MESEWVDNTNMGFRKKKNTEWIQRLCKKYF